MSNFHIVIPFNIKRPDLGNNVDPIWIDYRLKIFQEYTLKSLINQTDKDFKIWMLCHPESEELLIPKLREMRKKNQDMYFVEFKFKDKNFNFLLEGEPVYILKTDSDDLLHKDIVRRSKEKLNSDEITLLMFCNGYVYNLKTRKIYSFIRWSITFYVIYFPTGTFSPETFQKHYFCDQTKVRKRFNPIIDMNRMMCCLDHDMNLHNDPRREGIEIGKRTGQGKPEIEINFDDFGIKG